MKMIIGLMIIVAIDHLMINMASALTRSYIYKDDHWHVDQCSWHVEKGARDQDHDDNDDDQNFDYRNFDYRNQFH